MSRLRTPWPRWAAQFGIFASIQFGVLTILAMLFYAGGNNAEPTRPGYAFFANFFSDLGLTVAYSGRANTFSMILFATALTLAGLGLIIFFVAWPRWIANRLPAQLIAYLGSFFGIGAGLSYIGVAFTPANLLREAHINFVYAAFVSFFLGVLCYLVAILLTPGYRRGYAAVLGVFALLLAGYIWLLFNGPNTNTVQGLTIQVTGQKVIAYASITTLFIVALGANRMIVPATSPPAGEPLASPAD